MIHYERYAVDMSIVVIETKSVVVHECVHPQFLQWALNEDLLFALPDKAPIQSRHKLGNAVV